MTQKRNNLSRILFSIAATVAISQLFTGCASTGANAKSSNAATVRDAEKLIASHPVAKHKSAKARKSAPAAAPIVAEGPAFAMMPPPPALGPGRRAPVDTSRQHLFELYTGQQQIIESLEAGGPNGEGHAMDLPEDISTDDLINILRQQQKLIKALTQRPAKGTGRI